MRRLALDWFLVASLVASTARLAVTDWKLALLYAPLTLANVFLFVAEAWS